MSSILKALKKVEKERPFQGGTSPVAREILSGLSRPEKKSGSRLRWMLFFVLLLGGGAVGGVLLMQPENLPPAQPMARIVDAAPAAIAEVPLEAPAAAVAELEPASPIPVAKEVPVPTPPAPVAAVPDTVKIAEEMVKNTREAAAALKDTATSLRDTADKLKNKVIISSQAAAELTSQRDKKVVPVAVAPPVPVAAVRPVASASSRPVAGLATAPVAGASRTSAWHLSRTAEQPVPDLKVTEIHWQPAAKDRLAVVNNLPVLEGVDIEGARVDRIFKDRIRFIVNGRYLEVKVSSEPFR